MLRFCPPYITITGFGKSAKEAALDGQIIKAKQLEDLASK